MYLQTLTALKDEITHTFNLMYTRVPVLATTDFFVYGASHALGSHIVWQQDDAMERKAPSYSILEEFTKRVNAAETEENYIKLALAWEQVREPLMDEARDLTWRREPFSHVWHDSEHALKNCPLMRVQKMLDAFNKEGARVESGLIYAANIGEVRITNATVFTIQ